MPYLEIREKEAVDPPCAARGAGRRTSYGDQSVFVQRTTCFRLCAVNDTYYSTFDGVMQAFFEIVLKKIRVFLIFAERSMVFVVKICTQYKYTPVFCSKTNFAAKGKAWDGHGWRQRRQRFPLIRRSYRCAT